MGANTFTNGGYECPIMVQDQLKKNDSANGWISQKYGGTSVGKFPVQIADIVR